MSRLKPPKSKHSRSHSGTGLGVTSLPVPLQRLVDRADALNMLVGDVLDRMKPSGGDPHLHSHDDPLEHVLPFAMKLHGERIVKRTQPANSLLGQVGRDVRIGGRVVECSLNDH